MNEGYQSILETQGKNVYNQRDSFISFYFKYCPNELVNVVCFLEKNPNTSSKCSCEN